MKRGGKRQFFRSSDQEKADSNVRKMRWTMVTREQHVIGEEIKKEGRERETNRNGKGGKGEKVI